MSFDALISEALNTIREQTEAGNAVADKVIHADNANKLLAEVRETSDDPEIVKYREFLENAYAQLAESEKKIDDYILSQGMVDTTPVDVEAETTKWKEISTTVKAMTNAIKTLPGFDETKLADIPELKSLPGTRKASTSSGGTGVKRPRIASIAVTYPDGTTTDIYETKDGVNNSNLTVLAKSLASTYKRKVEVKDLQAALFAAAGTDDLNTLDGKPVEFAYSVPKSDNPEDGSYNLMVKVTPTVK